MYVQEANDQYDIDRQDRQDEEAIQMAALEQFYLKGWFEAVTTEPLDSSVIFDDRTDWLATGTNYKNRVMRESTVLELFTDQHYANEGDFDARIAKIVIDAHKAGSAEATKLLTDMAVAYAGSKT